LVWFGRLVSSVDRLRFKVGLAGSSIFREKTHALTLQLGVGVRLAVWCLVCLVMLLHLGSMLGSGLQSRLEASRATRNHGKVTSLTIYITPPARGVGPLSRLLEFAVALEGDADDPDIE
jgi:hypothetical protein